MTEPNNEQKNQTMAHLDMPSSNTRQ